VKPVTQSCMVYTDTPPEGVGAATAAALEGCEPRWSEHPSLGGYPGCLVERARWAEAVQALRDDAGFDMLVDHTAVDYPDRKPERFTVLALLMNLETQERLMLRTRVPDGESVPTLAHLYKSADWAERETFDMFGIPFEGHPDLTRIYMPQDYDGWPLRRDFPMQGHNRFRD
jgi:NADH-quinone oxidoreductase subunit C